jgi:hypothetical protein
MHSEPTQFCGILFRSPITQTRYTVEVCFPQRASSVLNLIWNIIAYFIGEFKCSKTKLCIQQQWGGLHCERKKKKQLL